MNWKITNRNEVLVNVRSEWLRVGFIVRVRDHSYRFVPARGFENFDPSFLSAKVKAA